MAVKHILLVIATATVAIAQRPFFAGTRPIGYPELASTTSADSLGNRFGEGDNSTVPASTEKLPVEANGDRGLVDRLSKLPIDQQPFWFINWQALEANRKNPQTYPLRPSQFAEPLSPNANSANNVGSANRNSGDANPNSANVNTGTSNEAGSLGNRFSDAYTNSGSVNLSSNNKEYVSSASVIDDTEKPSKGADNQRDVIVPGISRKGNPLEDTLYNNEPSRFQSNAGGSGIGDNLSSNKKDSVNPENDNIKPEKHPGTSHENPLKDTLFNNTPNNRFQSTKSTNSGGSGIYQLHGSGPGSRYSHEHDYDFNSPPQPKYTSPKHVPNDDHYDYFY